MERASDAVILIVVATPAPQAEEVIVLEGTRGGQPCSITIDFRAIDELRAMVNAPQEVAAGSVLGTLAEDRVVLQHCASASAQGAIGLFRTQPAGWASLTEPDRKRLQSAFPGKNGAVLLVVRTLAQRPWSAALFLVDRKGVSSEEAPLVEFPFDGYLLRNGWLTDLAPPPAPLPQRSPVSRRNRRGLWIGAVVAAGMLAVGGGLYESNWRPWPKPAAASGEGALTAEFAPPIGLRAARSLDEMEVSWNRGSQLVQSATGATLIIRNGPVTRRVAVTADQLREGRVMYRPVSGVDAEFRLELAMPDGRVEAESIQVLGFDTAPTLTLPVAAQPRPKPQPLVESADRIEAAPVTRTAAAPTDPQPTRRVSPMLGRDVVEEMRSAKGLVTISVLVSIDATGKVDSAKVVGSTGEPSQSGSHIRLAALNAAKQWRFRPATAGGRAVASTLTLQFSF